MLTGFNEGWCRGYDWWRSVVVRRRVYITTIHVIRWGICKNMYNMYNNKYTEKPELFKVFKNKRKNSFYVCILSLKPTFCVFFKNIFNKNVFGKHLICVVCVFWQHWT